MSRGPEINVIKKIYKYDEYITDNINESCDCVNYNIEIPDEKIIIIKIKNYMNIINLKLQTSNNLES